jgi:RNA polymerase sigma-70 factor (ECF subfamily)
MSDADRALMERLQAGDGSAFEVLVGKYQGLVLSLCRRYLGSRFAGVDDVAQQVFLRIHRGAATWAPTAKVKTWIYSIAVNACLNEIRRIRSKKERQVASFSAVFGGAEAEDPPAFADASAPSPSRSLEEGEIAHRVREAVDALPDQQRLALVLSRFHHLAYEDVAASMGTSVPAVKSLLMRARENLRRRLADLVAGEGAPRVESEKP